MQQHGSKYFTRGLPTLGGRVEIPLFQNMVMLHIKLKGMTNVLFVCFVALRPKSTAMVIAGRSVHPTTLFPGQA